MAANHSGSKSRWHSRLGKRGSRRKLNLESLEARLALTDVSGAIAANTVWTKANSPYNVLGDVTVQAAATLGIEPGVVMNFSAGTGITINGRLVAEGSAFDRIAFRRAAGAASDWDGLSFANTLTDSRITFSDFTEGDGQGQSINVAFSRLTLDNITWTGTTNPAIEMEHPSVILRNSILPTTSGSEVLHGEYISGDEYLIIEGNFFPDSNNGTAANDVVDILGADRPGPVMQILNNVFMGGGDDGLDLDGTDAHIEGNLFMNFHRTTSRATTSNAIATGLPQSGETNRTQITVVRNIFLNNDHHMLLKEDAFATVENNVFLNAGLGAIQFNEIGGTAVNGPGLGAILDGNIFQGNATLFKNLTKTATFQTQLAVNRSLLPDELQTYSDGSTAMSHSYGTGNISGDPLFVDAAGGNYRLQSGSPAIGAGPNGLDMGAYVEAGPTITGVPTSPSPNNDQQFIVAGPGITHYRFRIDGGPYSATTPVSEPINLVDLTSGDHSIDVMGMNDAGEWFAGQTPAYRENHAEVISPTRTRTGEALPMIVRVRDSHGNINTLLTTPASLTNAAQLNAADFRVKHGVGSLAPTVTAAADFSLAFGGTLTAGSTGRAIDVLDGAFPVVTHSGTLSGATVWDSSAEHRITGTLTIPAGSSLTIEAGTRVMLGDRVNILVDGAITSNGTAADPVVFNAINPAQDWGGIEVRGAAATGTFHYTFMTQGGADTTRMFGHSDSQPVLKADASTVVCDNCYIINNTGKALGSRADARLTFDAGVISNNDTGGQLDNTVVRITNTWIKDMPNDDQAFVNDDNDGMYIHSPHSSGEYSLVQNTYVINTKDDCIDHNNALLNVVSSWLEGCFHEGVASSEGNVANVVDTVVTRTNQGYEAGYGGPRLNISNSVAVRVNKQHINDTSSDSVINAGIRFGDGYNGSNGAYTGHITAVNTVVSDNQDNIRNWDGTGPQAGAIDITYSLTNDADYNAATGNLTGVPVFGPFMHLLRGSVGLNAGSNGETIGRLFPTLSRTFTIEVPPIPIARLDEVQALAANGANSDRIELTNVGGATLDLSGMTITNDVAQPAKFTFAEGTTVAPGARLVLFADTALGSPTEIHVGFTLDAAGDEVLLYDTAANGGGLLDSVTFGRQINDRSIARMGDGSWRLATPTFGSANTSVSTGPASGIKLNEWLSTPGGAVTSDFIELFNPAALPVDIGGTHLTNNVGGAPDLFTIRPLTFMDAGGLALYFADNNPAAGLVHLNFELAAGGGTIALTAVTPTSTIDTITYGVLAAGVAQGRTPNGSATVGTIAPPTPGTNNPGPVVPPTTIVNLQDGLNGYSGTTDTWIGQQAPTTTHGGETPLNVDSRRTDTDPATAAWGLIKWDLASIPTGSIVVAASITLDVTNASTGGTYDFYTSLRPWNEAQANWNVYATGQSWQTAGGTGASDRGTTILGSLGSSSTTGQRTITLNADGRAALEGWIADANANNGFFIYNASNLDGIQFRSRDYNTTPTLRPKLTIEYSLPGDTTPPAVTAKSAHLDVAPQNLQFSFSEEVLIDAADLLLFDTVASTFVPTSNFAMQYNSATNTATFTFPGFPSGVLPSGSYSASLDTAGVTDLADNDLATAGNEPIAFSWLRGDVNADATVNAADIDTLYASFSGANSNPRYDLSGDGKVDQADVDVLVTNILATSYGDADLNHVVDRADAAILASHYGGNGGWASGNFTGDVAGVDLHDLVKLQQNIGFGGGGSPAASSMVIAAPVPLAANTSRRDEAHRLTARRRAATDAQTNAAADVALETVTDRLSLTQVRSRRVMTVSARR